MCLSEGGRRVGGRFAGALGVMVGLVVISGDENYRESNGDSHGMGGLGDVRLGSTKVAVVF